MLISNAKNTLLQHCQLQNVVILHSGIGKSAWY